MQPRVLSAVPPGRMPAVSTWTHGTRVLEGDITTFPLMSPVTMEVRDSHSPFELSSYNPEDSRKTLTLRLSPELDKIVEDLENDLVLEVTKTSEHFFGEKRELQQVAEGYKPISRKTGTYPCNLRSKVNTTGLYSCRYWTASKERTSAPPSHANAQFNARVVLRGLWFAASGSWGLIADCTDLQSCSEEDTVCPF